jgi:hypothetical protein
LVIRAIKVEGGYTLLLDNGDYPTEKRVVSSKVKAYRDCDAMYNNGTWHGLKLHSGYEITID